MNTCAALLCLSLSFQLGGQPGDRWIGEDKWMHLVTSFVVTSLSASAARTVGFGHDASIVAGMTVGAGAGIWKEFRDLRGPQQLFSYRDLVWDAAGIGAAAAVLKQTR